MLEVLVSRSVVQSAQLVDEPAVIKVESRVGEQLEGDARSANEQSIVTAQRAKETDLKTSFPIPLDDPETVLAHEGHILTRSQDREHLIDRVAKAIVVRLCPVGDAAKGMDDPVSEMRSNHSWGSRTHAVNISSDSSPDEQRPRAK